ncbi:putative glycosyltransferase EpsE, partial [Haemophilus influenzae]
NKCYILDRVFRKGRNKFPVCLKD